MAITFGQILGYLNERGLRYQTMSEDERVVVPFGGETASVVVIVDLVEDGEGLIFRLPNLLHIADTPHQADCLRFMLHHNYRVKIGMFGFDRQDGEVVLEHFIPIEDGDLTSAQFHRVLRTLLMVHRTTLPELQRIADGQADEGDDPTGSSELTALQRLLQGAMDEMPDSEVYDPAATPTAPVDEQTWLGLVCHAFRWYCRSLNDLPPWETMRTEVWPRLRQLAEDSVQAGQPYRCLALPDGLGEDDLYVLCYMLARQAAERALVGTKAIDLAFSPGLDAAETKLVVKRLVKSGVVMAADGDGQEPWVLTSAWLDPLAAVLPFAYTPAPAMPSVGDLPAAPCDESLWLRAAHRAALAVSAERSTDEARVARLRDELWPRLLAVREASRDAGRPYETLRVAAEMELSAAAELVVLYVAAQSAAGEDRVSPRVIDLLYSPGVQIQETIAVLADLSARGLLRSSDRDGMAPYTAGTHAAPWQAA